MPSTLQEFFSSSHFLHDTLILLSLVLYESELCLSYLLLHSYVHGFDFCHRFILLMHSTILMYSTFSDLVVMHGLDANEGLGLIYGLLTNTFKLTFLKLWQMWYTPWICLQNKTFGTIHQE